MSVREKNQSRGCARIKEEKSKGQTWSIECSAVRHVKHFAADGQQDPSPILAIKLDQLFGCVLLEKESLLSFERDPGVGVVVGVGNGVEGVEGWGAGREEEGVDEVDGREGEQEGEDHVWEWNSTSTHHVRHQTPSPHPPLVLLKIPLLPRVCRAQAGADHAFFP